MIALLDTNVLIRFLTSDKTQKFHRVYALFESLEQGALKAELKLIVLFEGRICFKKLLRCSHRKHSNCNAGPP